MNAHQEDKFGMFLKCELFFTNHAADFAGNPAIATLLTQLTANINGIVQADSTATRNLTGVTATKKDKREELEIKILTVAAAARGYYTTTPDRAKKMLVTFAKTDITGERDSELLVKADQVHDVADPVKTLLTPWGVADTDVDGLLTTVNEYRGLLQKPRSEEAVSESATVEVARLFTVTDTLLSQADDQLAVLEYTNNGLFVEYRVNRSIDDSGGGSGSEGYDLHNFTIPAGGWVVIGDAPAPGENPDVYIRDLSNGSAIICTTDGTTGPCASGYTIVGHSLYKAPYSGLGLTPGLPKIQMSNPGTDDVLMRAGTKKP